MDDLDMKNILILIILIGLMAASTAYADATFYLVRHAEKVSDGSKDPHLSELGHTRAFKLAQQLSEANISKIYSTDYKRTQETAKPLADILGLSVESYDPRQLEEFAETLKKETGNILIVGHSNTTPALTYLLSGAPIDNIDDSEYENLYEVVLINGKARLNRLKIFPMAKNPPLASIHIDINKFKSGSSTFNMLFKGEIVGQSIHSLKNKKGQYQLHEKTTIQKMGIDADIYAQAHEQTLAPLSMSMTGSMGAPVDINLNWQNNHVKGHSEMARALHHPQGRLEIDHKLSQNIVERTSLIMLAHLLNVNKDQKYLLKWFNGYDGFSREIVISYEGEEKVVVPAGEFDTYKVLYQGGAPSQLFYISKAKHPEIVKIEIPTMPWTYELVNSRH